MGVGVKCGAAIKNWESTGIFPHSREHSCSQKYPPQVGNSPATGKGQRNIPAARNIPRVTGPFPQPGISPGSREYFRDREYSPRVGNIPAARNIPRGSRGHSRSQEYPPGVGNSSATGNVPGRSGISLFWGGMLPRTGSPKGTVP